MVHLRRSFALERHPVLMQKILIDLRTHTLNLVAGWPHLHEFNGLPTRRLSSVARYFA